MTRNVVVGRVRAGVARETVEQALAAIVALDPPGCPDTRGAGMPGGCDPLARIVESTGVRRRRPPARVTA